MPIFLRWDGVSWRKTESETTQRISAVFGIKAVAVWAVGAGGALLRYLP